MPRRIELPNGEWAEVKTAWEVSRGQRRDLFRAIRAEGEDGDSDVQVIQLMITSWSRSEPVTAATIDALPVPVANVLTTAAVEFVKELSPDFSPDAMADPKAVTDSSESSAS